MPKPPKKRSKDDSDSDTSDSGPDDRLVLLKGIHRNFTKLQLNIDIYKY